MCSSTNVFHKYLLCTHFTRHSTYNTPTISHRSALDDWRWRIICASTNQEAPVQDQVEAEAPAQVWQVGICGHNCIWQTPHRKRRGASCCREVHIGSRFGPTGQEIAPGSDGNAEHNRPGGCLAQGADAVSPNVGSPSRPGPECRLPG